MNTCESFFGPHSKWMSLQLRKRLSPSLKEEFLKHYNRFSPVYKPPPNSCKDLIPLDYEEIQTFDKACLQFLCAIFGSGGVLATYWDQFVDEKLKPKSKDKSKVEGEGEGGYVMVEKVCVDGGVSEKQLSEVEASLKLEFKKQFSDYQQAMSKRIFDIHEMFRATVSLQEKKAISEEPKSEEPKEPKPEEAKSESENPNSALFFIGVALGAVVGGAVAAIICLLKEN